MPVIRFITLSHLELKVLNQSLAAFDLILVNLVLRGRDSYIILEGGAVENVLVTLVRSLAAKLP